MKILIVDDTQDARMILKTIIETQGYEVETAFDGKDALEKARKNKPDMIISDILMPVMDGFSLCREVRQDNDLREIPFVFYTATYIDDRDEKLALEMGANRFIRKPLDPVDFISAISEVIDEAQNGHIPVDLSDEVSSDPVNEKAALKLYNERLILKLEKKMLDLEKEIARRRRSESELTFFRSLADQSNDAYFVIKTDTGGLLDVNSKACENLGYNREELLQKTIMDIVVDLPDLDTWHRHMAKVRKAGNMIFEKEHRRKDGLVFPVEVSVKILTYKDREYSIVIARDLRERKKVQQAMEESQKRFHSLVASSTDHIFMLDFNSIFLESNDQVAVFPGISLSINF